MVIRHNFPFIETAGNALIKSGCIFPKNWMRNISLPPSNYGALSLFASSQTAGLMFAIVVNIKTVVIQAAIYDKSAEWIYWLFKPVFTGEGLPFFVSLPMSAPNSVWLWQ